MDHRSSARPQVPQRQATNVQPAAEQYASEQREPRQWAPSVEPPRRKKWPFFVGIPVVVALLALAIWWVHGVTHSGGDRLLTDRYQAVFLDNGQVFFGKLKNTSGEYMVLENAYYTKKQDVPESATDEQKQAVENNVSLAKVGSEVYGPETSMSIRSEQVLFWQNLSEDSKVSNAIKNNN